MTEAQRSELTAVPRRLMRPGLVEARARFRERARQDLAAFLSGGSTLSIPVSQEPKVSIVIAAHNAAELTLVCLQRIAAHAGGSVEVIVVDNASTDETAILLGRCPGIRVIRNADNAGYLDATNQGAAVARGEFLVLLNSDAFIRQGTMRLPSRCSHRAPRSARSAARRSTSTACSTRPAS